MASTLPHTARRQSWQGSTAMQTALKLWRGNGSPGIRQAGLHRFQNELLI
jgi:hypothetical protein